MNTNASIDTDVELVDLINKLMLSALVGVLLAISLAIMSKSEKFDFQKIIIKGETHHHSVSTLRENVIPHLRGNFYTINLQDAKNKFEALPWISTAEVRRAFPNMLEVNLREHKAVAVWGSAEDARLVNERGIIFESNANDVDSFDKLPQFLGNDSQSKLILDMYARINQNLMPLQLRLAKLELTAQGSWIGLMNNGAEMEIGRGSEEQVSQKIKQFARTIQKVSTGLGKTIADISYADLRHENGYAVKLTGVSTVERTVLNSTEQN